MTLKKMYFFFEHNLFKRSLIKEIALDKNIAFIHAITSSGGEGKSKYNNEHIDIYERFKFNIEKRKGVATSVIKNSLYNQSKFGTQGIIIYDGKINNVNQSDAGTAFNDEIDIWESPCGIQFPNKEEVISEIESAKSYVEVNVYNYLICGFFLDLSDFDINYTFTAIRSLNEFYEKTKLYKIPYYCNRKITMYNIS